MLVSVFVCLIELVVQQLTVVYTKAAGLTTSAHDFVDGVELFFGQLRSFKLGKNDFNRLFVFWIIQINERLWIHPPEFLILFLSEKFVSLILSL